MKIKVNKHNIEIDKEELINEKEVNVSKCYFEFSEEYTDSMVKKALFTKDNKTYEMLINNNECDYPSEILESEGTCILGVYAYTTENEFTRFNPTPQKFAIELGSLRLSENSQPITPSEMEQYQQALQNGLNEVNKELEEVMQIGSEVAKQGEYATKQGDYAKSVGEQLEKDKENGLFKGEQGEKGEKGDTGEKGDIGPKGEPGKDGENGKDGYTPIKGKDYFDGQDGKDYVLTEADKEEIAANLNEENNNRITTNEKYISDLEATIDILTNTNTSKGELVHITDALPLPTFENVIDGNVKQETTEGYNLIGLPDVEEKTIAGLTFSIKNGLLTLNGTATVLVPLGNVLFNNLKETNKYRLQIFPQSGTWDNGWIGTRGYIDGTQKWYQQIAKTDNTNYIVKTLTVEEFENNNRCDMYIANGSSFNNFSCYVLFKKGEEYANYEPYTNGASPNPDYQQPIEVLEAYNLLDKDNYILDTWDNNFDAFQVDLKAGTYTLSCNSTMATIKGSNHIGSSWDSVSFGTSEKLKTFTFTINQDYKGGIVIRLDDGTQINHTNISDYDIQLVKGTIQKPYLPYGCVGYKVNGKNIFDRNRNGYTVKPTYENDKILWQGIGSYSFVDYKVNCKPNTKYAISFSDKNCTIILSKKSNTTDTINWDVANNYVFTTTDNMNEFYIRFTGGGSLTYYVDKFQIELDKATKYEPFQEQIVPLDLKGNWVGAINDDIKDYLVTDKKKFWLVKNVNRGVISLTNTYGTDNDMWFFFAKPTDSIDYGAYTTNGFSEVCIPNAQNPIYFSGRGNISIYAIVYNKSKIETIPTIEELKELVDGKYFYYQLAKPEIIYLGELPEPIKTFEGTNNIQLLANLDTEIEVKYGLDLKKYFDNKLASIQEQIL